MKSKITVKELLGWRFEQAKVEAAVAPGATRLLDLAMPWWERSPQKFESAMARLDEIQLVKAHTTTESNRRRGQEPVPALVVRGKENIANSARVRYFHLRDGKLRLRFKLDTDVVPAGPTFEVTFIADTAAHPLFCVAATVSASGEYNVNAAVPADLAQDWGQLKVVDRMPFRLILRSGTNA